MSVTPRAAACARTSSSPIAPSTSVLPFRTTGGSTPGTAALARTALTDGPAPRTSPLPVTRSVAVTSTGMRACWSVS